MPAPPYPAAVYGGIARYIGPANVGGPSRYYWVLAYYPSGQSQLAGPFVATNCATGLANGYAMVMIEWNPMPGALWYDVIYTSTSTPPSGPVSTAIALKFFGTAVTDYGQTQVPTYVSYGATIFQAYGSWNFAVDGGAVSTITINVSDTIPANAILIGGVVNFPTAVTSGGSLTMSVGLSAGASGVAAVLAATAVASLTADSVFISKFNGTPIKMSAAGVFTVTIATAAATAGTMEVFVQYVMPSRS